MSKGFIVMQKILNALDKFSETKLFGLFFDQIKIGTLCSLTGLRVNERLETIRIRDLGSSEDLAALIKALKHRDINYAGVNNSVLMNLFDNITLLDFKRLNLPLFKEIEGNDSSKLSEYIDYNTFWEILVILLTPKNIERI